MDKVYVAIDLKSFYASVECVDRGRDPLTTNLVVADESRTEKTICLAVSPPLKEFGVPGRPRLFEVIQKVNKINAERQNALRGRFRASTDDAVLLRRNPALKLDFIIAPPRMARYMDVSARVYEIYLKYAAPEDIHVYSVDEVFIDATEYLRVFKMTAREYVITIVKDVLSTTGITATAGIGTNLYLAKVAMDIVAKHIPADEYGVRIAELDEMSYREKLWDHRPLTDFWRIGPGIAARLASRGLYTMGDVAACSAVAEDTLYRLFGVNAELIIDHAWGWEPCTIADIRAYRPGSRSLSCGQVLKKPYTFEKGRIVLMEMADSLSYDLVAKGIVTDQLTLTVGYDVSNVGRGGIFDGDTVTDRYGRALPSHSHGTRNLEVHTSSTKELVAAAAELYDRIADRALYIRRMYLAANRVLTEKAVENLGANAQICLFEDPGKKRRDERRARELRLQKTALALRGRYGKNALIKGIDLEEDATTVERNGQVGGHRA